MAASEQVEAVNQIFRDFKASTESLTTVEEFRMAYENLITSRFTLPDDVTTERVGAGGVAAEWVAAPGAAADKAVIHLHGGGYLIGSNRTHRVFLSHLSRATGARALGLDYRLAPEFPFPAAVWDTVAAYRWLLANGMDPKKIMFSGDSAGGGLLVSAMIVLRYDGDPLPAGGIGISPWTDLANTGKSLETNVDVDPIISKEMLDQMAEGYMGGKDPRTPLASPFYADLNGLPPLLLQVGEPEGMVDDAKRFAEKAKEAGVDVTLEVWPHVPHIWPVFAPILPEGQQALDRAGEFFRKHTK
jgi:acetyl esterase/lipase